jgi:hypothetical protein
MKEVTAIRVIQKDAEFLGMGFLSMMKFIETNPLAQTSKTLEAFKVLNPNFVFPMKTVKNLMTGKLVQIEADTPWCCNPASETYWSM